MQGQFSEMSKTNAKQLKSRQLKDLFLYLVIKILVNLISLDMILLLLLSTLMIQNSLFVQVQILFNIKLPQNGQ